MFEVLKKDKRTKARLGLLKTPHGIIKTPSYVFVGTYGRILHLSRNDIKNTKTQVIISNTFHLWDKVESYKNSKSVIRNELTRNFGKLPIMTDSGGFQVLSLAFSDKNKVGKFMTGEAKADKSYKRSKIKITEKGVHFLFNGKKMFLGPELSMKLQEKIGADILFAFDHITSPLDTYKYNQKALRLTNKWAKICLKEHATNQKNRANKQILFGIVQGGLFKDLRIQSAKSIGSMPFDGFGIGGSYTKKQIAKVLKWIIPHLPEEKPRHLLGVGKVEDIFEAIENGVDTFDCVIPTREARHGRLYTKTGYIDIRRGYYSKDKKITETGCGCFTCTKKISRAKIRELIKSKDRILNAQGQRWCLMHNMWFFNNLLEDIRKSIAGGKFKEFKKKTLTKFKS
ncbi:MAG: tRNA guanosine(34) transglycosylase Tgt [Candidatus Yanofskybacteria bacterium]|nr:tRNA guanosine(34) transglycosylase Tgt [Candidatus Yanofskybacteria bacterium]